MRRHSYVAVGYTMAPKCRQIICYIACLCGKVVTLLAPTAEDLVSDPGLVVCSRSVIGLICWADVGGLPVPSLNCNR